MKYNGWYQAAFERDLTSAVTPLQVAGRHVIAVRIDDRMRVFDAACPHRGAHLGYGGCLEDRHVVCAFHGCRVKLGEKGKMSVAEIPSVCVGGCLFVCFSPAEPAVFADHIAAIDVDHFIVPGFELIVRAPAPLVIENAFDNSHFKPVHKIRNEPEFIVLPESPGTFAVSGTFQIPASRWQRTTGDDGTVAVPFVARAFSPHLVVSQMGGAHPYQVITSATPLVEGSTAVRLSIAIPAGPDRTPPSADMCQYLLKQSRSGIEADAAIWERMLECARPQYTVDDGVILRFRDFCGQFAQDKALACAS